MSGWQAHCEAQQDSAGNAKTQIVKTGSPFQGAPSVCATMAASHGLGVGRHGVSDGGHALDHLCREQEQHGPGPLDGHVHLADNGTVHHEVYQDDEGDEEPLRYHSSRGETK